MLWAPIGCRTRNARSLLSGAQVVQALVQGAHAALAQVDLDHQARPQL